MIDTLFPIIWLLGLCAWIYFMFSIYDAVKDLKIEGEWLFFMAPYLLFIGNEYNVESKKKKRILIGGALFIGILGSSFCLKIFK